jgi:hypothetical protein
LETAEMLAQTVAHRALEPTPQLVVVLVAQPMVSVKMAATVAVAVRLDVLAEPEQLVTMVAQVEQDFVEDYQVAVAVLAASAQPEEAVLVVKEASVRFQRLQDCITRVEVLLKASRRQVAVETVRMPGLLCLPEHRIQVVVAQRRWLVVQESWLLSTQHRNSTFGFTRAFRSWYNKGKWV